MKIRVIQREGIIMKNANLSPKIFFMDFKIIKHTFFLYKMEYLHTQTNKIIFEKSEERRGSG